MEHEVYNYVKYETQRKRKGIIINNYTLYCVNEDKQYYRCTNKSCIVKAKILSDEHVTVNAKKIMIIILKHMILKKKQ